MDRAGWEPGSGQEDKYPADHGGGRDFFIGLLLTGQFTWNMREELLRKTAFFTFCEINMIFRLASS